MNHQVEDHMALISQLYPSGIYTQMLPQQGVGEPKPTRRRRKRSKTGGGEQNGMAGLKKRKLRAEQVHLLEKYFENEHKLESERKDRLASELCLDPRQVAVWFQNRRARWKNKKLEEEYSSLKKIHEFDVLEKSRLESEILKMQGQLSEAKKEIQRLSERADVGSSNSTSTPSSSHNSMEQQVLGDQTLIGQLDDGYGLDVFYMQDQNNYIHGMEWVNL